MSTDIFVEGQSLKGVVTNFDEHVGLGEIRTGDQQIPFHCVSIKDETRYIEHDMNVAFKVHWHPRGRFEAIEIEKV